MFNFFYNKIGPGARATVNEVLTQELHKPVIKKLLKRILYAWFKDNIWAANLAEMVPLFSRNRNDEFLLCAIDVFTKYAWVKPLKYTKTKTVFHGFIEIVSESKQKSIKKTIDADYSALSEEIESIPKAPKFRVGEIVRVTKYKNTFSKGYAKRWLKGILRIDSVLKINPWTYKNKVLNGETIIESFYEKELLWSKL